jgi:hypothetical protein
MMSVTQLYVAHLQQDAEAKSVTTPFGAIHVSTFVR